jgi:CheY-like chemotaxis protein
LELNLDRESEDYSDSLLDGYERSGSRVVRALVVDDLDLHLRLTCRFLRKLGIEADTAKDGEEALKRFRYRNYNFVLLDLNMPRMDGFVTARKIRALNLSDRPFLVACSASLALNAHERCLAEGLDGYLSKPIRTNDLHDLLEEFHAVRKIC